jgi:hypothetical protein
MVVPMVRSGGICISHLVNFIRKFVYLFFTFSAICEDNTTIKCFSVQHIIRKFVYLFFTFNAICEDNTTINYFSVQHKENVHSCQLVGLI